jgi:ketosteroid isomerase-like protein
MDELADEDVREIERVHSSWMEFELAGDGERVMELCADDVELWPPDGKRVVGRGAVSAQVSGGTAMIHGIEISDRRIRGSGGVAYLTANYRTTFSSDFSSDSDSSGSSEDAAPESAPGLATGSHLWVLRKVAGKWMVCLVSWTSWKP